MATEKHGMNLYDIGWNFITSANASEGMVVWKPYLEELPATKYHYLSLMTLEAIEKIENLGYTSSYKLHSSLLDGLSNGSPV